MLEVENLSEYCHIKRLIPNGLLSLPTEYRCMKNSSRVKITRGQNSEQCNKWPICWIDFCLLYCSSRIIPVQISENRRLLNSCFTALPIITSNYLSRKSMKPEGQQKSVLSISPLGSGYAIEWTSISPMVGNTVKHLPALLSFRWFHTEMILEEFLIIYRKIPTIQ